MAYMCLCFSENLSDELGEEESHGTGSLEGRSDLSKADDGVAFVTVINNGHEKGEWFLMVNCIKET